MCVIYPCNTWTLFWLALIKPTHWPCVVTVVPWVSEFKPQLDRLTTHFFSHLQVVSQGNILIGDELRMISRQKTFSIALSRDMVPSARIIVFYIRQPEEIVVDALNFFVNGTRLNPVSNLIDSTSITSLQQFLGPNWWPKAWKHLLLGGSFSILGVVMQLWIFQPPFFRLSGPKWKKF